MDPIRLKYPIILIHGMGAPSQIGPLEYFYDLPKRLRAAGNQVFIANVAPWHTIDHRAKQLKAQIEKRFPEGKVNLVGHSLGGLDARYLASCLGFHERIASITTIGTPNRGSMLGDVLLGLVPDLAFNTADRVFQLLGSSIRAFHQVTHRHSKEVLNSQLPNMSGIAYFSATSAIPNPVRKHSVPIFWVSHPLIHHHEGDNDGFVSVQSATWGDHICTYAGDHYAQIGQLYGSTRGMNHMAFHEEIFAHLKKAGM